MSGDANDGSAARQSDRAHRPDGRSRPDRPRPRRPDRPNAAASDGPVLPDVSRDETDVGWGDEPGERSDDWYRRERPPHHE